MGIQRLTAENATIKTATVEVKTLTISGKQVTLAVFRQLPKRELFNRQTLDLHGVAWGTVNYHPDKCGDEGEHIHVVWQFKQTLARACVGARPMFNVEGESYLRELARSYAIALIGAAYNSYRNSGGSKAYGLSQLDEVLAGQLTPHSHYPTKIHFREMWIPCATFQNHTLLNIVAEWNASGSPDTQIYEEDLAAAAEELDEWRAKYDTLYETLSNLDQLYIAV